MNIRLQVSNENGFISGCTVDLTKKFQERGIQETSLHTPYSATSMDKCLSDPQQGKNNQFNAVSGGQLLPEQPIRRTNKETSVEQTLKVKPSVNIRVRYDANEPPETRWNIEIYSDMDNPSLDWGEKRLITMHPKNRVHKVRDSQKIELKYWVDGIEQDPIVAQRPSEFSTLLV